MLCEASTETAPVFFYTLFRVVSMNEYERPVDAHFEFTKRTFSTGSCSGRDPETATED